MTYIHTLYICTLILNISLKYHILILLYVIICLRFVTKQLCSSTVNIQQKHLPTTVTHAQDICTR